MAERKANNGLCGDIGVGAELPDSEYTGDNGVFGDSGAELPDSEYNRSGCGLFTSGGGVRLVDCEW